MSRSSQLPLLVSAVIIQNLAMVAHAQTESPGISDSPAKLPDVVVQGSMEQGYAITNATASLKADVPLLETPQAVSVISRTLIEDQAAGKLEDALRNVAGVSPGGYYGEWDYFRIRGFDASATMYLDGLLGGLYSPTEELWGLERVEVIKGPASSLYGQGSLGGFVNMISKRPRPEAFNEVQLTAGSFDTYEAAFDLNAPLNKDTTVYGRLNALYNQHDSFVDFAGGERFFIAPSLTWVIGSQTTLTLLASLKNDQIDMAFPLPARGTVLPNPNGKIPISRYIGNPRLGNDEWERLTRVGYELKHEFDEHLALRNNFRYERNDWTSDNLSYPDSLEPDNRTLNIGPWRAAGKYQGYRVDTGLDAHFETGPIEHTLIGGIDYRWTEESYTGQDGNIVQLDVFNPDYNAMPDYTYGDPFSSKSSYDDLGLYVQEHARWKAFTLTVGGRYDWTTFGSVSDEAFTPRVGLTYEIVKGLAAYANYSQSFNPQWYSTDANGDVVEPETGENFEIGLKAELLDGKVYGLLAVYQLTRENVATSDLSTSDPFDFVVSGEQRSRGVELEGGFRPMPGLEFTGAYTYINAEVTHDNDIPVGTPLQGVPEHAFSAWVKYTLQDGPLKGLGFGLGGRYYTEQSGDTFHTFDLPAYGLMDAAVYYRRGRLKTQVNINNILDTRYFAGSYSDVYVLPGEPLSVQGSVNWSF